MMMMVRVVAMTKMMMVMMVMMVVTNITTETDESVAAVDGIEMKHPTIVVDGLAPRRRRRNDHAVTNASTWTRRQQHRW